MSEQSWLKEFYPVSADEVPENLAIKHSLQKWYGLRKESLSKHDLSSPPIDVNSDSCSLCQQYNDGYCNRCPLAEFNGTECDRMNDDRINIFVQYIRINNPEPMIAALEAIEFVERTCK